MRHDDKEAIGWAIGAAGAVGMLWWISRPVQVVKGRVYSEYGPRGNDLHRGLDIEAPVGSPVRAALAGEVVDMSPDGRRTGYGNVVILRHGGPDDVHTFYAHLDRFAENLEVGDWVNRGQLVGYVGTTQAPNGPMASPPHLHIEVLLNPQWYGDRLIVTPDSPERVDPLEWLHDKRAFRA